MKSVVVCIGIALAVAACKKSSNPGPGGGGGGSGWLVGTSGLMVNVHTNGDATGYPLTSSETLNGIACSRAGEAWVVGAHGTLFYTSDEGASWQARTAPTSADLRALATQDSGAVFIAGDGVFLTSNDTGATWNAVGDSTVSYRSLAAAQGASTVLTLSEDGTVFSFENGQLVTRGNFPGAHTVAIAPDGETAMLVGDHLIARSSDAGRSWTSLASGDVRLDDVRIDEDGEAIAVGSAGAIAHISSAGQVALQRVGTADLHTLHIAEPDEGEGGATGFAGGEGGAVLITLDGGATWRTGPSVGRTVLGFDQIGALHR